MSDLGQIMQALGRIEGTVNEIKEAGREHREDDKRRFADVYKQLGEHADQISEAKGASKAFIWLITTGAGAIGGIVAMVVKAWGKGG